MSVIITFLEVLASCAHHPQDQIDIKNNCYNSDWRQRHPLVIHVYILQVGDCRCVGLFFISKKLMPSPTRILCG